jgi:hypothetical protein
MQNKVLFCGFSSVEMLQASIAIPGNSQLTFRTLYRDVLGVEDYESTTRGEGMERDSWW